MEKGSKKITAKSIVKEVQNYAKLKEEEISDILESNQNKLALSPISKEALAQKMSMLS